MVLSRTQESEILDLHLVGLTQRKIAKRVDVCLESVNKRIKQYKEIGTTHMNFSRNNSQYNAMEEVTRQRIRYYLSLEKRRNKYTLDQLHELLTKDGFDLNKSTVGRWLKLERNRFKEGFLDIFYEPGRMVQFDWGSKKLKINGHNKIIHFAVFALPFSNYRYVHVTTKMDGKSFTDAFISFTKHLGCVFPIMLIDNMKIAVRHHAFRNNQVQLTTLFVQLEKHYGMEVRTCTPYRPNQKGTVENAVATLKQQLNGLRQDFQSIKQLQHEINLTFKKLNSRKHPTKNDTCINLMMNEKALAKKVPSKHFIHYQEDVRRVNNNTLVSFDGNYYSAPEEYKGEKIIVKYNDRTVKLVNSEGKVLAKYSRCYGKGYKKYRVWNILGMLHRKSHGFDQSNQKKQLPPWLKKIYREKFDNNTSDFVIFLEMIKNIPKSTVKRMLKYHDAYDIKLTPLSVLEFITRY